MVYQSKFDAIGGSERFKTSEQTFDTTGVLYIWGVTTAGVETSTVTYSAAAWGWRRPDDLPLKGRNTRQS